MASRDTEALIAAIGALRQAKAGQAAKKQQELQNMLLLAKLNDAMKGNEMNEATARGLEIREKDLELRLAKAAKEELDRTIKTQLKISDILESDKPFLEKQRLINVLDPTKGVKEGGWFHDDTLIDNPNTPQTSAPTQKDVVQGWETIL